MVLIINVRWQLSLGGKNFREDLLGQGNRFNTTVYFLVLLCVHVHYVEVREYRREEWTSRPCSFHFNKWNRVNSTGIIAIPPQQPSRTFPCSFHKLMRPTLTQLLIICIYLWNSKTFQSSLSYCKCIHFLCISPFRITGWWFFSDREKTKAIWQPQWPRGLAEAGGCTSKAGPAIVYCYSSMISSQLGQF